MVSTILPRNYARGKVIPSWRALRVDRSHPLARGLVSAFLPGVCNFDICGNAGMLTPVTGGGIKRRWGTPDGPGIWEGNAQTQILPAALNNPVATGGTIFWRGLNQGGSFNPLASVGVNVFAGSGSGWGISSWDGGNGTAWFGTGSRVFEGGFAATVAINTVYATFTQAGALTCWVDGVQTSGGGTNGPPGGGFTVSGTGLFVCGYDFPANTSNVTNCAYFYNRALSLTDLQALTRAPYQFIVPKGDDSFTDSDILLALGGVTPPAVEAAGQNIMRVQRPGWRW